jgi:hydrogenase maturation factor
MPKPESVLCQKNKKGGDKMNGLKLAASYSWNCNTAKRLRVCENLHDFILGKAKTEQIAKEILELLVPYKFYCAIAKANNLSEVFSPTVVSFYWRGWPKTFKSPGGETNFFHNHTVAAIAYSQPLEKIDLKHMNECLASGGQIEKIGKNFFTVEYQPVVRQKDGLAFGKTKIAKITNQLKLKAKKNNFISFHYGNAAEIISPTEANQLNETTQKILQKFNAQK